MHSPENNACLSYTLGVSPDTVPLLSQRVLSFGIPLALIPLALIPLALTSLALTSLVLISRRRDLMGDPVNRPATTFRGWVAAPAVSGVHVYLFQQVLPG